MTIKEGEEIASNEIYNLTITTKTIITTSFKMNLTILTISSVRVCLIMEKVSKKTSNYLSHSYRVPLI